MYEMPAEVRAMHDARAEKSNPSPFVYKSSVSLIKLLRHFKHHGNQKRETLLILHVIYNRLKPEGVDYWEMKLKDVKKYLQCTGDEVKDQLRMGKYDDMDTRSLLSYVNSGNYVVEDVGLHVRDKAIFEAIDSHFPNFLGQIFVGSFFEGVQDYIPDFDFPRDHNDDDAMSGELLHGQPAGGSNDIPTDRTLYVENLHFSMTEQQLQQIFEPFGHVEFLQLPLDPETGQCKGFGFVQFAQVEHAKAAQSALNGNFAIAGQVIKVLSVDEYMN